MQITDRFLTIATGVVLAVAGGGVSLWLGEDHSTPDPVVVAALSVPHVSMPDLPTERRLVVADVRTPDPLYTLQAPDLLAEAITAEDAAPEKQAPLVFAAVEPGITSDAGPDLAQPTVSVADAAPEIAKLSEISGIVLTRSVSEFDAPSAPRVAAVEPSVGSGLKHVTLPATPAADCALDVRATRLPGARVRLSLTAPCHPGVAVTVEHAGLRFKEQLNRQGYLSLKVPVFEEYAQFDIRLSDGTHTTVGAYVADLSALDRVGISWQGDDDTFLHARAAGSRFDGPGHVWRMRPGSFAQARMSGGGYLVSLGDPNLPDAVLAQVYTLPHGPNRGTIVSVDIETLRQDCAGRLGLSLATFGPRRGIIMKRLVTHTPACGSDGSLVLKNVVKDLNVAAR